MSLINDALRKANKTQKQRRTRGPMGAPVQTVESLKRPAVPLAGIVGAVALLTALVVGVWAFAVWWKARNTAPLAETPDAGAPVQMAAVTDPSPAAPTTESRVERVEGTPLAMETPSAGGVADRPPARPVVDQPKPETPVSSLPATPVAVREAPPKPALAPPSDPARTMPAVPAPATGAPEPPTLSVAPKTGPAPAARPARVPFSAPPPSARVGEEAASASRPREPDFVNLGGAAKEAAPGTEEFPELNLQGIFYRLKNPSVLINRRALYVGDEIAGAKVVEIQRRTVTLEKGGVRRTLSMGGY